MDYYALERLHRHFRFPRSRQLYYLEVLQRSYKKHEKGGPNLFEEHFRGAEMFR